MYARKAYFQPIPELNIFIKSTVDKICNFRYNFLSLIVILILFLLWKFGIFGLSLPWCL